MADKNDGNYVRDQVHPEFTYDAPSGPEIPAVGAVAGASAIAPVSGPGTRIDPLMQWQAFSEQLRARRLAQEEARRQLEEGDEEKSDAQRALEDAETRQGVEAPDEGRMREAGQAYARQAPRTHYSDRGFQAEYESDTLDFSNASHQLAMGLHRHLSTVRHPIDKDYLLGDGESQVAAIDATTLQVGQVMTRKVVCVMPSTTIEQVASVCNRRGFSGVPVVNELHSLVGIVTLSDILRQIMSQPALSSFAQTGGTVLEQRALAVLDEPVRNYMHEKVICIAPEASVQEACALMLKHHIRRLVVAHGDVVKGIFSAQDAVRVMANMQPGSSAA